MYKKLMISAAVAAGAVLLSVGTASAATVQGASPESGSVNVVGHQNAVVATNGPLVDARCALPWSNGAVLGGTLAPGSHYVACNGVADNNVYIAKHQNAVVATNGPLVDLRCAAPWSNGAVLGLTLAPGSHYVACNSVDGP